MVVSQTAHRLAFGGSTYDDGNVLKAREAIDVSYPDVGDEFGREPQTEMNRYGLGSDSSDRLTFPTRQIALHCSHLASCTKKY